MAGALTLELEPKITNFGAHFGANFGALTLELTLEPTLEAWIKEKTSAGAEQSNGSQDAGSQGFTCVPVPDRCVLACSQCMEPLQFYIAVG